MSMEFSVRPAERVPDHERARRIQDPPFGQVFTDHMITIRWEAERGWHDARLEPYGPLPLDPSAQVFHYGQAIFEGLKAYRRPDGSVVTFRPGANARRLNRSAARIAMPALPEEDFLHALDLLLGTDRDWVPALPGHSLYVRPFMIATEPSLGVHRPSARYLFAIIASPAGSYFKNGVKPVSAWLSTEYVRAAPGGTGEAKFGGNYAGTFLAQRQAAEQGCDQVVWLDAGERRWVDEMGTCNLFFVYGSRLVTPALTGTLLAGVTRDSVITLARDLGYKVEEGRVNVADWRADAASGALTEVFTCATSSLLTPVDRVKGDGVEWTVGGGSPGPVTTHLHDTLTAIQQGTHPDKHDWIHPIT